MTFESWTRDAGALPIIWFEPVTIEGRLESITVPVRWQVGGKIDTTIFDVPSTARKVGKWGAEGLDQTLTPGLLLGA